MPETMFSGPKAQMDSPDGRWASSALTKAEQQHCAQLLLSSTMFSQASLHSRLEIASRMRRVDYDEGDVLHAQDDPCNRMFCVAEGEVKRYMKAGSAIVQMDTLGRAGSDCTFGILHLLQREPYFATAKAITDGTVYVLDADVFSQLLSERPLLVNETLHSLSLQIRADVQARTPFLEQKSQAGLPVFAICAAAASESLYRSALNAAMNAKLTGKWGALFPNMHIQTPMRVLYILGFKSVRFYLDTYVSIAPTLVMDPFMSDKKLRSLFKGIDMDNSGVLDRGEIRELAKRLGKNMGEHKLDAAMREMDRYAICGLSVCLSSFKSIYLAVDLAVMAMA